MAGSPEAPIAGLSGFASVAGVSMFYSLDTPDLPPACESWLLHERHPRPDGPPRVRDAYRHLRCRKCNRVDEPAALSAGVVADFRPPPLNVDAFTTNDWFLVVTRRAYDTLLGVPGLDVAALPAPASPGHLVLFPKRQFHPPPDARVYTPVELPQPGDAFQVRGGCRGCGRRQTTFRLHWLDIPADVVLAGAMVEPGWPGVSVTWIASQAVVDAIRGAGLTGWTIRPADADKDLRWG